MIALRRGITAVPVKQALPLRRTGPATHRARRQALSSLEEHGGAVMKRQQLLEGMGQLQLPQWVISENVIYS